ncbi:hypothetical protein L208DRAFT_1398724 [Tricholoma matsutake]|nr:hypothetical protein L208DRAFT_1398724 [Tricholoma matsutake 945]
MDDASIPVVIDDNEEDEEYLRIVSTAALLVTAAEVSRLTKIRMQVAQGNRAGAGGRGTGEE